MVDRVTHNLLPSGNLLLLPWQHPILWLASLYLLLKVWLPHPTPLAFLPIGYNQTHTHMKAQLCRLSHYPRPFLPLTLLTCLALSPPATAYHLNNPRPLHRLHPR